MWSTPVIRFEFHWGPSNTSSNSEIVDQNHFNFNRISFICGITCRGEENLCSAFTDISTFLKLADCKATSQSRPGKEWKYLSKVGDCHHITSWSYKTLFWSLQKRCGMFYSHLSSWEWIIRAEYTVLNDADWSNILKQVMSATRINVRTSVGHFLECLLTLKEYLDSLGNTYSGHRAN